MTASKRISNVNSTFSRGTGRTPWSMHSSLCPGTVFFFYQLSILCLHIVPKTPLKPWLLCHNCWMCCRTVHVHECCTVGICTLPLFMLPRWTYSRSWRSCLISHINISQCSMASQYGVVLHPTHPKKHWILRFIFLGCMPLNCNFSNLNDCCHDSLFLMSWFWHWDLSGFSTCLQLAIPHHHGSPDPMGA